VLHSFTDGKLAELIVEAYSTLYTASSPVLYLNLKEETVLWLKSLPGIFQAQTIQKLHRYYLQTMKIDFVKNNSLFIIERKFSNR
jgi:hypothetical protein